MHHDTNEEGRPRCGGPALRNHHDTSEHSCPRSESSHATDSPGPLFDRPYVETRRTRRESSRTTAKALKGQNARILAYLNQPHRPRLDQMQAYDLFGCVRLPARINDLRAAGYQIDDDDSFPGRLSHYYLVTGDE